MKIGIKKGSAAVDPTATTNKAGGVAFNVTDPADKLLFTIGHMMNEPKFYPDSEESDKSAKTGLDSEALSIFETTKDILNGKRPKDALAIAAYARKELHMRTTPVAVLAAVAEDVGGGNKRRHAELVRAYAKHIIARPDEIVNVFAVWRHVFATGKDGRRTKMVPNALKRALRDVLINTPEHSLVKWDKPGRPNMADVIRLCAPELLADPKYLYFVDRDKWLKTKGVAKKTPVMWARHKLFLKTEFDDETMALIRESKATWEDVLSKFGSTADKKNLWDWCIPQMGYMALIRNIRNMVEANVDLTPVLAKLSDRDAALGSKQLPFRFLSTARIFDSEMNTYARAGAAVEKIEAGKWNDKIRDALDTALGHVLSDIPKIKGHTAIFVDNSGSMSTAISSKSAITMADAANMLAAATSVACEESSAYAFTDKPYKVNVRKSDSVLTNMARMAKAGGDGGSTNAHLCPPELSKNGIKVDRIILISDMQCYDDGGLGSMYGISSSFAKAVENYRKWCGKTVRVYSVNMAGTEESQTKPSDKDSYLLSGFSEKLLKHISSIENASDAYDESGENAKAVSMDYVREKYYF